MDRATAWACGIVTMRQQPETAKGVVFVTHEYETGSINIILWRHIRERQCTVLVQDVIPREMDFKQALCAQLARTNECLWAGGA